MNCFIATLLMTICLYLHGSDRDQTKHRHAINFNQALAITKTVEQNQTTLYVYLPKKHRVTICHRYTPQEEAYSGELCCLYNSKLAYSVPVLGVDGLFTIEKKKLNQPETQVICLIGPKKSKNLFNLYNYLFNTA